MSGDQVHVLMFFVGVMTGELLMIGYFLGQTQKVIKVEAARTRQLFEGRSDQ